jgi:hypothetical protein
MRMMKAIGRPSAFLAYVLLLTGFVALGAFVAALATGSDLTAVAGVFLIASLAGSVAGFRAAGRKLAQSGAARKQGSPVSIFSTPLRQDEIDRYLENHRGESRDIGRIDRRMVVLAGGQSAERDASRESRDHAATGAAERLSA